MKLGLLYLINILYEYFIYTYMYIFFYHEHYNLFENMNYFLWKNTREKVRELKILVAFVQKDLCKKIFKKLKLNKKFEFECKKNASFFSKLGNYFLW